MPMSRAIGLELAVRLARSFELLDDDWGLSPLAEAFADVLEPDSAQEIAGRVIELIPVEPVDPVNTLRRVLVDLPKRSAPCCTTVCARALPHRTATNTTTFALTSTA